MPNQLHELHILGPATLSVHEASHLSPPMRRAYARAHLSPRLHSDCRLSWEACSTCEEDNDPEWTCPAAAAVYNDLRGASSGLAANIVEVEGSSGKKQETAYMFTGILGSTVGRTSSAYVAFGSINSTGVDVLQYVLV